MDLAGCAALAMFARTDEETGLVRFVGTRRTSVAGEEIGRGGEGNGSSLNGSLNIAGAAASLQLWQLPPELQLGAEQLGAEQPTEEQHETGANTLPAGLVQQP